MQRRSEARRRRWLQWLLPGLGSSAGRCSPSSASCCCSTASTRWLIAEGVGIDINEIIDDIVDDFFSPAYLTWILRSGGIVLIALRHRACGCSPSCASRAAAAKGLLRRAAGLRLQRGYKIVAIGGGTGLSTLLRGLKRRTSNLTAIVTVSDDGGTSGRLQKELGVLPPGDIRNCLVALADDEALVTDLFRYRFNEGEGLSGHSFGNLFLAAMSGITGNFDRAIKESSRVLNIVGRVLPATLPSCGSCAELDDGTIVEGESNISQGDRTDRARLLRSGKRRAAGRSDRSDSRRRCDRARPRIALHLDPAELFGRPHRRTKSRTRMR